MIALARAADLARDLDRVPAGHFVGLDADGVGSHLFTPGERPEFPPGTVVVAGRWDDEPCFTASEVLEALN